jgi:CBS domain containing-hemolysin-like protein
VLLAAVVWVPAAVARVWSAPFLFHTWRFWLAANRALWPLTAGVNVVEALLRRLAARPEQQADEEEAFEDEIRTMVREGLHEGLLEEDAREMIEGVMDLDDTYVSDIMTPRSKIDAIDANLSWPEVLDFVIRVRRTRIPVYENTLDKVIGVLYVKDLLPELANSGDQPAKPLRSLLREPWFVPMTNAVDEMLQEFLRTRNHLAIAVDEYRALAGVVTIEDVLEEIVGEIIDEHDQDEEEDIQQLSESSVEAAGRTHLDDLNKRLGAGFPEPEDHDTIGGFVISRLRHIPKAGESIVYRNVRITVLQSNRRRIDRVRLERLAESERETAATP